MKKVEEATAKKNKIINLFTKVFFIFVLLQPFLDVLSNLYNYGFYKINFVTYLKPLFVFGIFLFLFFFVKYKKKFWYVLFFLLMGIYILLHSYLLYCIFTSTEVIIHEVRFIVNIIYFIMLFINLKILYEINESKEEFYKRLKKVLFISICIYVLLYIMAIVTNTSWLTYEFSDKTKLGYRGWNYSGQIFGHLLCISLPIVIYTIFKLDINKIVKTIFIALLSIPFLLIGTKVPFYILLLVSGAYILINIFYKILHHEYKIVWYEFLICFIVIGGSLLSYKHLPVYNNTVINNSVTQSISQKEDLDKYNEETEKNVAINKDKINQHLNDEKTLKKREELALKYEDWTLEGLKKLNEAYESGKIHSSDNRDRQLYFMHYKFMAADWNFKLLGIGYLNQPNALMIERDIIMPLYAFGISGFLLLTIIFWIMLFKLIVISLKNIKKLDVELLLLAMSFCMFFFISFYAGSTYIYTQFAMILAIIMSLLAIKLNNLQNIDIENNKKERKK